LELNPLFIIGVAAITVALATSSKVQRSVRQVIPSQKTAPKKFITPNLEPFRYALEYSAKGNAVDVQLIAAIIGQESNGNPNAVHPQIPIQSWIARPSTPHYAALKRAAIARGWTEATLSRAYGLTGILGGVAVFVHGFTGSPDDLKQPTICIELCARELERLTKKFKTLRLVVIGYNGGEGTARQVKNGGACNTFACQTYAPQVLARLEAIRKEDL
jgi:Transglycosylase SLT domain